MSGFYKFHEAREKAKKGDEIYLRLTNIDTSVKIGEPGEFKLSWEQYDSDQWQIIPAKKEMVDFDDWFDSISGGKKLCTGWAHVWQASAKNRDILYADLMEAAQNYLDGNIASRPDAEDMFKKALKDINAVLSTSSAD